MGFNAAARSVLMACKHPQEPETFVLSTVKGNLCATAISLSYRTAQAENGAVKLERLGECPYDADEIAAAAFDAIGTRKLVQAVEWLRCVWLRAPHCRKLSRKKQLKLAFPRERSREHLSS